MYAMGEFFLGMKKLNNNTICDILRRDQFDPLRPLGNGIHNEAGFERRTHDTDIPYAQTWGERPRTKILYFRRSDPVYGEVLGKSQMHNISSISHPWEFRPLAPESIAERSLKGYTRRT